MPVGIRHTPKKIPINDFATPKPGQDPDEFAEALLSKWVPQMPPGALQKVAAKFERLIEDTISIPPRFSGLFQPARYKIYYGGRGGAKSHSFARVLVRRASKEPLRILCTREFQSSINDSVYRLICDQITLAPITDVS